jgi:hypothetical protein
MGLVIMVSILLLLKALSSSGIGCNLSYFLLSFVPYSHLMGKSLAKKKSSVVASS